MTIGKNKGGRPSSYSAELAEDICERMANGESLRAICAGEGMPAMTTVMRWEDEDRDGFADKCAHARRAQAQTMQDKAQEVADNVTPETAHAAKVQISTYQWIASKMAPRRYGDKLDVTSDGKPILPPQPQTDEHLAIELSKVMASLSHQPIAEGDWREVDDGSDLA